MRKKETEFLTEEEAEAILFVFQTEEPFKVNEITLLFLPSSPQG